jgi:hypothetical protein
MYSDQNDPEPLILKPQQPRQGRIILRSPWRKAVFIAGLAGAVLFMLLITMLPVLRGVLH